MAAEGEEKEVLQLDVWVDGDMVDTIRISRSATVGELKSQACCQLMLAEDDVEIWDFYNNSLYANLDCKKLATLTCVRLFDNQGILLRGKNEVAVPRPFVNSLDVFTKPADIELLFDDGSTISAHRWLLELCSGVLSELLATTPLVDSNLPLVGDSRKSWLYVLQLIYPSSLVRRPPVAWLNLDSVLQLADKYDIKPVFNVCEDFLLQSSTSLSSSVNDHNYVWKWLIFADKKNMGAVVTKCIQFIKVTELAKKDVQLEKSIASTVDSVSKPTLQRLLFELILCKDQGKDK